MRVTKVFPKIVEALVELGYMHQGDQGIPHRKCSKRPTASSAFPRHSANGYHTIFTFALCIACKCSGTSDLLMLCAA